MLQTQTLLFSLLVFSTTCSFAQTQSVQLKLKSLKVEQAQEESGDELYFSITDFSSKNRANYVDFPQFPSHWLSTRLDQFKAVTLWKESMSECESKELMITLVERDTPPWNIDDALGTVKLKLECEAGKMKSSWIIPPNEKVTPIPLKSSKQGAFYFNGDEGKYRVEFEIDTNR